MHELGILESMLNTVKDVMAEENMTHVEKIVLQVGEISGVVPYFLEDCFPVVVLETPFVDTKLEIEVIPGRVRCKKCGKEYNANLLTLQCECGSKELDALSGREFLIKEIYGY